LLTLALDGGEQSLHTLAALCVGPRVSLNVVARRKIPSPCWESNPSHLAHSLDSVLTELSWLLI